MQIQIGLKAERMRKLGEELIAAADQQGDGGSTPDVALYGQNNETGGEATVIINNDDMERPEVAADHMYVEVDGDY